MRAATTSGFIMVGGQDRQTHITRADAAHKDRFQPKIVRPNLQRQGEKEIYYKSIQSLAKRLDELITDATEPDEIEFWQARRNQIKGYR